MSMTAGTIEDALRERHLLSMSTDAACLTRIGRIDFDELPTSFFRFAGQLSKECRPRGIDNAFSKAVVMHHAVDRQVFDTDDSKAINNGTGLLMGKVITPELDPFMDTGYNFAMLAPLGCTFCQLRMFPLHLGKSLFFFPEKAWVRNFFTCRERSKGFESNINTYAGFNGLKYARLTLAREADVPLARRRAMHRTRLDLALHGAMVDHLDGANLRESHTVIMGDGEPALRVGETIVASITLEPGIARLFSGFASAEECFKGKVNADSHVLKHLGVNTVEGGALFFQHRISGLLLVARQAFAVLLIGILARGQQMIIQPSALFKRESELLLLFLGRVDPILKVFKHISIICLNKTLVKGQVVPNPSRPIRNGALIPRLKDLILTHIFLGRPEKPITMDGFVNQSTVAPGLSGCFIQPNCKMWVKDRLKRRGLSRAGSVNTQKVVDVSNVFL